MGINFIVGDQALIRLGYNYTHLQIIMETKRCALLNGYMGHSTYGQKHTDNKRRNSLPTHLDLTFLSTKNLPKDKIIHTGCCNG